MNDKQLHRPTSGTFACLTFCNGEDVYIIFNEKDVQACLNNISECIWIIMNAKFDLIQLRRWAEIKPRKKLWDIMLIERILYNGYFNEFSLQAMARRYLDIAMEKETREEFAKRDKMTPEMTQYACLDSYLTLKIYHEQYKRMDKNDFNVWTKVDRPALWAVLDFVGMPIDPDGWNALAELNRQRSKDIDAKLPFNPRSPKQVVSWLKEHGFKTIKASGADELERLIAKYPKTEAATMAQLALESRVYSKRAGTYGESLIKDFVEMENGYPVIYANFNVTGAESGRMSSSDPNMQNIPARETKEYRQLFKAHPGYKLVVLDYSAQEPCITAFITQDKRLIETFKAGKDVYCEMWYEHTGEEITKKDKEKRSHMKPVFLGATYGLSKYGLSKKEKISVDDADEFLMSFFKSHPGVARWSERQRKQHKYVTTIMGRKCWLNSYTDQAERNALNDPIQGTASEMMKMALGEIHEHWDEHFDPIDYPFAIAAPVHDEIVLHVPEEIAEAVGQFASKIMVDVGEEMLNHQIPMKADYFVCDDWSQKG